MRRMKLSETKIITWLKEAESGIEIEELCRNYAISASTFYRLKAQYSGMEISQLKRLKELERENSRLKQMYADVSIENNALRDVIEKKLPQ